MVNYNGGSLFSGRFSDDFRVFSVELQNFTTG